MCLAKAYLSANGGREILIEEVASLRIEGNILHLRTLFGEQMKITAAVREIDFQNPTITLEKLG